MITTRMNAPRGTRLVLAALLPSLVLGACSDTVRPDATLGPVRPALALGGSGPQITISQVYGGGGNVGATYTNDFIELYNAGTTPIDLTGWSVQYAATSGTSWQRTNLSGSIQPGGSYLIQESLGSGGTTPLPTPDASGTIAMSATAGKVALVNSATTLSGSCPLGGSVIDFVGFGSATNCSETTPTSNLSNTTAAIRKGGGSVDTDNNSSDFTTTSAPTPRNSALGGIAVTSTMPAAGATNVAAASDIQVTFNKPVTVSGSWYSIACSVSGAHGATVSGGANSYALDPTSDFTSAETCTVKVTGSLVADAADASKTMAADQSWSFTVVDLAACTQPFTGAYAIQGSGNTSPLVGQNVTTQGVVVGDYEGPAPTLRGFYVQDAVGDADPTTSDAIFVFNGNNNSVKSGDVVRVTGSVSEFQDQTQVSATGVLVCQSGASITPVDITLPAPSPTFFERYEGMLVRLPQTLYVTEHFQLGRFGQVVVSPNARLAQPTNLVAPGGPALALQAQNNLASIIIDDGDNNQNADPIVFARGGQPLSATNTLRGGDAATGVTGVLTYTWAGNSASGNAWRVRPVNALGATLPNFAPANPRPSTPPSIGGSLKVAAMNLLNYFNTFGTNACNGGVGGLTMDCRGADNSQEFARQKAKTVAAIVGIDADVLGIIEMENDGYGSASAIADLTNAVNAAIAPGTYAYVDVDAATGQPNALGSDAIKVGVLYKPSRVTPIGATAVLNSTAFVNGGDSGPRNRPALAQAFETPDHGRFVFSVNHLKSKGSACDAPDALDGQGNCNTVRTNAANLLKNWLASDPTGILDSDVIVVGDLNSYAKEDPIAALTGGGFTNLISQFIGADAYSYAFDGQWGYLDHALASPSLASQVTGVAEWHINADEPSVLDYNTDFKSASQVSLLYAADQYRVSDHDPIIVGLSLTPTEVYQFGGFLDPLANAPDVNSAKAGSSVPLKFSLGGNRGTDIFAPGYPASQAVACGSGTPDSVIEEISTPGQSGLQYDASSDRYSYVWKTDKSWSRTCRALIVKFKDASVYTARFSFAK